MTTKTDHRLKIEAFAQQKVGQLVADIRWDWSFIMTDEDAEAILEEVSRRVCQLRVKDLNPPPEE